MFTALETRSRRAFVAAGHPVTTDAAAGILRKGGNAFDAVVAAGFASAVAEPVLTGLGGGGFLLARTAEGRETLFDFFVDTPGRGLPEPTAPPELLPVRVHFGGSEQEFNVGLASVAVPGNLKGYLHVHERLGRLPLETVLEPAVRRAHEGVRVTPEQAYMFGLLEPILTLTDRGRAIYAPGGRPLAAGDVLVNEDLASFLGTLPRCGAAPFHSGGHARRIAEEMGRGGGLLTLEDLAAYEVVEREPLALEYAGHRLLTNPPPSLGGSLLAMALELRGTGSAAGVPWLEEKHLSRLAALLVEVERLRELGCSGPGQVDADEREAVAAGLRSFSRGTTHVSVADGEGNAASMTTSNGEGSGYVAPGTGVMLNNMMGEDDLHPGGFHSTPAGHRVGSMMSPSILVRGDRVALVVGSGGSKRIRSAVLQVISHVVDFGRSVRDAVDAPRIHWDGTLLQVEPGLPLEAVDALRRRWPVNSWTERNMYFGGVNAVVPSIAAAADPRRGGSATFVEPAAP